MTSLSGKQSPSAAEARVICDALRHGLSRALPDLSSEHEQGRGLGKCIGPFGKLRAGSSSGVARFARDSASSG
jgi:hypothetical protein